MKKKNNFKNVYLLIVSILISLFLIELYMRFAKIEYPIFQTYDHDRGFALIPNSSGWWIKEGEAFVEINSQGLRDVEREFNKDSKTIRIAVLGDSFTEARSIPLKKTFWKLMEKELKSCIPNTFKNIEVINFGVTEYSTTQQLITLQNNVWKYKPDIVLLAFYSGNDVSDNSKVLSRKDYRPFFTYKNNSIVIDNSFRQSKDYKLLKSTTGQIVISLSEYSRIIQLLKEIYVKSRTSNFKNNKTKNTKKTIFEEYGNAYIQLYNPSTKEWIEAWNLTEEIILMMNDEVKNNNSEFIVLTLSNSRQVHPDTNYRNNFKSALKIDDLFYPDKRIKSLGNKNGFQVFNLAEQMQKYAEKNNIFLHGFKNSVPEWKGKGEGHWNLDGHFIASKIVSKNICGLSELFKK